MSNFTKKFVAIATALTLSVGLVAPAQGATVEELNALIASLTAQLASLTAQMTALQGGTTSGTVSGCTITSFNTNLSQGMTNADVKCLQVILNSDAATKIASTGAGSPGNETTYFGSLTKAAVVKFQNKYASTVLTPSGLTAGTGYVGPATRAKLNTMFSTGGTGGTVIVPSGSGLTVSLAADNPAAATIVADTTSGDGAQALIPALKVTFTNGNSSAVKVTKVSFNRTGISADADLSAASLYEGDTWVADYNSFSSGVLTFNNASGVFTVPAGSSKTITLKFDLANGATSGKTIKLSINSASDISSDASAVNGTFPIAGNFLSTATTGDVGTLTINSTTSAASAIDPQTGVDLFGFNLVGATQILKVYKLTFAVIGSVDATDLANLKLYESGVQIGSTMQLNSDKTVTFDLSSSPVTINKGVTKNMTLRGDIIAGTNRTFRFTIQNMRDVVVYDTQYGIYLKANKSDTWTILSGTNSTINTGKLTMTRNSASPSGNIPLDGTNVEIAKFDVKATGEPVKITGLSVTLTAAVANGLYQGQIIYDGAQVGTVTNLGTSSATAFTFGNTLIIPADGANHSLVIKADVKQYNGNSFSGSETITPSISSVTAIGTVSSASVSVSSASGFQLTVATGNLSVAKNQAYSDWSSAYPTAVPGASEVLVGSFVVSSGASEGANITAIKITDAANGFANLQNLKIYNGTKTSGTQIGSTQSSLATGTIYTFYPSPYISLAKNTQFVLSIYADVKTTTTTANSATDAIVVDEVDGTGLTTGSSINYTTPNITGQITFLSSAASLTIAQDAATPKSAQILAGASGVDFAKAKFTGGKGESISVTQVVVTATLGASSPTSSVQNVKLYDGTTQIGSTITSLSSLGKATFDLTGSPWVIGIDEIKTLTIKADVNTIPYATSAGTVLLGIAAGDVTYKGTISGASATGSSAAVNGNTMYTYKTRLTFTENASTPSGTAVPGTLKNVMYFNVTNDGSYAGYLNSVTFTMNHTIGGTAQRATTSDVRRFYLYDLADLTTYIASTTFGAASTATSGTQGWQTYNASTVTPVLLESYTNGYEIPAGTTKTFILAGDTSDMGQTSGSTAGAKLQFYVASGTSYNWDDGLSTSVSSVYTKNFPVSGGWLTY